MAAIRIRFGLRTALLLILLIAIFFSLLNKNRHAKIVEKYYSNIFTRTVSLGGVVCRQAGSSVLLVEVDAGHEFNIRIAKLSSSEEPRITHESQLRSGQHSIAMFKDDNKQFFGYCMNGILYNKDLVESNFGSAFLEGTLLSREGEWTPIWSCHSLDGVEFLQVETMWRRCPPRKAR